MEEKLINGQKFFIYNEEEQRQLIKNKEILDEVAKELPIIRRGLGLC